MYLVLHYAFDGDGSRVTCFADVQRAHNFFMELFQEACVDLDVNPADYANDVTKHDVYISTDMFSEQITMVKAEDGKTYYIW